MERIRIGNDIAISWALFENNGATHLINAGGASVSLNCGGYTYLVPSFSVQGNVVSFIFPAEDQVKTGKYKIVLTERNESGLVSSYDVRDAFVLVPENEMLNVGYTQQKNVEITSVITHAAIANIKTISIVESEEEGGDNVVTFVLTDGSQFPMTVKNGSKGDKGDKGDQGIQGEKGDKGDAGARGPAGIEEAEVSVDATTGTPSVEASIEDGVLSLAFSGIKGEKGDKGDKGNTGSSVDFPYELVTDVETDDDEKGLAASQGVVLDNKISQLGQEINLLNFNPTLYTLATYPQYPLGISNGYWSEEGQRKHIVIPAVVGMSITITANANGRALINFLKSYAPKLYATVQYSEVTGYNDRIVLNANETGIYIVPNDCVAIVIEAASYLPANIVLDGYSLASNILSAIAHNNKETINREKNEEIAQLGYTLIEGYLQEDSWADNGVRKSLILAVAPGDVITYIQQDFGVYYTFFKSFDFSDIQSNIDICSGYPFRSYARQLNDGVTAPSDAKYMCITYWVDFPGRLPIECTINTTNLFIEQITVVGKLNELHPQNNIVKVCNLTNEYVEAYLKNVRYSTLQVDANDVFYFTKEDVSKYAQDIDIRMDMALPVQIVIPNKQASSYSLLISENPSLEGAISMVVTPPIVTLNWLKVNTNYWYAIMGDAALIKSGKLITKGSRRLNPCESIYNIRDLGGQIGLDGRKIRQGMLYRGGVTNNMTESDKTILQNYLGIQLVCGLAENVADDDLFDVATFHPYDLQQFAELSQVITVRRQYIVYIRKIIDYIKDGKPVFYHCNGGADRTGLMSAMLEGLCGVSENDICMDYELTSFSRFINGLMLSRTRKGAYNENGDYQYRNVGFGNAMKFVRSQTGGTYADKWVSLLTDSAINGDGYTALTLAEIEIIREALLE